MLCTSLGNLLWSETGIVILCKNYKRIDGFTKFMHTILMNIVSDNLKACPRFVWSWTYYKWTYNGSLSLITSWPPPPDNVHLDEHIHVSWQCWLRNHESSLTKGPFTSLRIHFAEVPFQDIRILIESQLMRSSEPKIMKFVWYKIDYYRSGHWRTCIWPCLTVRNTCPLLSLHLIILEYGSDQFKTEVVNHDNAAKFTGLSCKLH